MLNVVRTSRRHRGFSGMYNFMIHDVTLLIDGDPCGSL